MRTKLLIAFIAAMLMVPSAALATESDARSDRTDEAVDVVEVDTPEVDTVEVDTVEVDEDARETDRPVESDVAPKRDGETDEPTRRCLEADKVTDRCCAHFADENPQRCRDHLCRDTDQLSDRCCRYFAVDHPERCRDHTCDVTDQISDRCCLHLADDHPERCRDHEVDRPNYRNLFWRLFKAGEWRLIIRLLNHLEII